MATLLIPASIGELIDKITILEIKVERLQGTALAHVSHELALLQEVVEQAALTVDPALQQELRTTNEALWEIEDQIRDHERRGDFGDSFIQLARSVYITNDRRAATKRRINETHGSAIIEEKSYQNYYQ